MVPTPTPFVLLLVKEEDMEMVAGRLYRPSSSSSSTSALANSYKAAAVVLAVDAGCS